MDIVDNSSEMRIVANHVVEAFGLPKGAGPVERQICALGGDRFQALESFDQRNPRSEQ